MNISSLLHPSPQVHKFLQHGREYYSWKNKVYPFPVDEAEGNRLDVLNNMIYKIALGDRMHLSRLTPSPNSPLRILDIGYGTGLWAQLMAERYPAATIIAFDLDGYIPSDYKTLWPNLTFRRPLDFTDDDWGFPPNSFDLIHVSLLCGSVPDWPALYAKIFRYLKPHVGHLEHIEIDFAPQSHTDRLRWQSGPGAPRHVDPQPMLDWWRYMCEASARAGRSVAYRSDTEEMLEERGFVNPHDTPFKLYFVENRPDRQLGDLSRWFKAAMGKVLVPQADGDDARSSSGGGSGSSSNAYRSLSLALFTGYLHWPVEAVDAFCERVLDVADSAYSPLYNTLHVWTARKPG